MTNATRNDSRALMDKDKRSGSRRISVNIEAKIKQDDLNSFPTLLTDLSTTGFKLSCTAQLNIHKTLFVKLPGLELLTADIKWAKNMEYGCQFRRELYHPVFEHIVKHAIAD